MALDGADASNQLQINGADIGAGQVVTLTADVSNGQLVFNNAQAGGGEYNLALRRVSAAGRQEFNHTGLAISATDTHYADYGAWDGSGPMTLYVDHGSDGTVDETYVLENQDLQMAQMVGTATLQGRPTSPHPAWITILQLSLYELGSSTPRYAYQATTDQSGRFDVSNIPPGNYDVRIKGSHTLANFKRNIILRSGLHTIDFGTLLEGDANDDNAVTILDYSILRTAYGTVRGQPGYDERADFNQDGAITILDYSLLRTNYGRAGE